MSDNNIIRFPTTPKERTRFLAKSENPIHRNLTRLRHLTGWALVFSCVVFLATNFTMLSPSSISQTLSYIQITQAEPDSTLLNSISYPTGAVNSAAPFGGGLALVDSDTLYVAQTGGLVQQSTQLSYTDPVIRSNGSRALTFDRGGKGISLSTAISTPVKLTLENTILDASLGQSNDFAVVTGATGYRAAVSVYTDDGEQRFRWSTPDYYVQHAALSPSGKRMCALAFYQKGIELRSKLLFFDLGKDAVQAEIELGSAVSVAMNYTDENKVLIITDIGLLAADLNAGSCTTLTSYTAEELLGFSLHGDRVLLATRAWSGGARCTLSLYNLSGLIGTAECSEEPVSLSLSSREAVMLTASGLRVYDHDLIPRWENPTIGGANRVLMTDNGSVWTLYSKYASLITRSDADSVQIPEEKHDGTADNA